MLTNSIAIRALMLGLIFLPVRSGSAAELRCPPRLPGPHPGFEQVGPVPAAHWLLRRMQLFNARRGENSLTEIVPSQMTEQHDGFTLNWRLAGTEDLTIVCVYNGSGTYYLAHSRLAAPTLCTMRNDDGLTQGMCEVP